MDKGGPTAACAELALVVQAGFAKLRLLSFELYLRCLNSAVYYTGGLKTACSALMGPRDVSAGQFYSI